MYSLCRFWHLLNPHNIAWFDDSIIKIFTHFISFHSQITHSRFLQLIELKSWSSSGLWSVSRSQLRSGPGLSNPGSSCSGASPSSSGIGVGEGGRWFKALSVFAAWTGLTASMGLKASTGLAASKGLAAPTGFMASMGPAASTGLAATQVSRHTQVSQHQRIPWHPLFSLHTQTSWHPWTFWHPFGSAEWEAHCSLDHSCRALETQNHRWVLLG